MNKPVNCQHVNLSRGARRFGSPGRNNGPERIVPGPSRCDDCGDFVSALNPKATT